MAVPLPGPAPISRGGRPYVRAAQVQQELGDAVDLILEDGPCAGGLPSTILNVVQTPPRLIRAGAIGVATLEKQIGKIVR